MPKKEKQFAIQDGQTVVFIGDSITDCGRRLEAYPLGEGYVRFAVDLIAARYPERKINFINSGISGDVCTGLQERWQHDVLDHRPDWVSVMIGINDLHRRYRVPPENGVPPETYRSAYLDCLTRTVENIKAQIILMDPFYICRRPNEGALEAAVLEELPQYIAVVQEMARTFKTRYVPLQDIFQHQLQFRPPDTFCPEPVHPYPTGHLIIAHAWLSSVDW
jgi:lysophospholipase L1-like esterase